MVSVTTLLIVGTAGAAVHEDEADDGLASGRDQLASAEFAGSAPTSKPVTTSAVTSPSTSTVPSGGLASETLERSGPAGATTASAVAPTGDPGATASGSGLAVAGNGEIASGEAPLAETGSYPLSIPGALLLMLGGASRALLRKASRPTV